MPKKWTAEAEEVLVLARRAGKKDPWIADRLGISLAALKSKRKRMKLPPRPSNFDSGNKIRYDSFGEPIPGRSRARRADGSPPPAR